MPRPIQIYTKRSVFILGWGQRHLDLLSCGLNSTGLLLDAKVSYSWCLLSILFGFVYMQYLKLLTKCRQLDL